MPPRSDSERYENAALRLKNGTPRAWQSLPWVTNRAAARLAKEGSTVVSTVKGTGVAISLACEKRPAQLQTNGRAILRHGPNIKHRRCGMTVRHLSAKTAKTTPGACTTGTVMLPWDAATRLKFGSCQPKHWEVRRKHIADGNRAVARFWLWSFNSSWPLGGVPKFKKCNFIFNSSMDGTNWGVIVISCICLLR